MTECWRKIPGWTKYMVSDMGRVKRLAGWDAKYRYKIPERILKPVAVQVGKKEHNYKPLFISLSNGGRPRSFRVAVLVLLAFRGPSPPGKKCALHEDDNLQNNRLSNLRWGSQSDNAKDRIKNGLTCVGSKNGNSKFTEALVRRILHDYNSTEHYPRRFYDLAEKYGVGYGAIWSIVNKKGWKHVWKK